MCIGGFLMIRKRTHDFEKLYKEFTGSDSSLSEFARSKGIPVSTLSTRFKKFREEAVLTSENSAVRLSDHVCFVPIQSIDHNDEQDKSSENIQHPVVTIVKNDVTLCLPFMADKHYLNTLISAVLK